MAFRITFCQNNQFNGLPTQGTPVADYGATSPATAPVGTQYAIVSFDGVAQIQASNLKGVISGYDNKKYGFVNAGTIEIPNVQEGSVITVTES